MLTLIQCGSSSVGNFNHRLYGSEISNPYVFRNRHKIQRPVNERNADNMDGGMSSLTSHNQVCVLSLLISLKIYRSKPFAT